MNITETKLVRLSLVIIVIFECSNIATIEEIQEKMKRVLGVEFDRRAVRGILKVLARQKLVEALKKDHEDKKFSYYSLTVQGSRFLETISNLLRK